MISNAEKVLPVSGANHIPQSVSEQVRVFRNDDDTLYWGDALTVLEQQIDDESVNLIFADPPYNIGKKFANFADKWPTEADYEQWCYRWLDLCISKLTSNGSLYLMASTQSMPALDLYLREHLTVLSRIVWHYDSSGVQAQNYFGSQYEPILFCVKNRQQYTFNESAIRVEAKTGAKRKLIDYRKPEPAPYNSTKIPGNVWYYARVRYRMDEYEEHPSQKPESLLERIIQASSNPGDTVLDPFSGTFTTSAVAQRLNRRTIGIELEKDYVKIGLRRLHIQRDLDGEVLQAPKKNFKRRTKDNPGAKLPGFD